MEAFHVIYTKYFVMLRYFAEKFIDSDTAQDLVQDVFINVWMNKDVTPDDIQSYLFRSVRNRCLNHLEHLKVKAGYEEQQKIDLQIRELNYFQSPEQLLIRQEQLDRLAREIDRLPDQCRKIFRMAYLEEKKAAEIATMTKLSVRTVETQIYKALKTLRKRYSGGS